MQSLTSTVFNKNSIRTFFYSFEMLNLWRLNVKNRIFNHNKHKKPQNKQTVIYFYTIQNDRVLISDTKTTGQIKLGPQGVDTTNQQQELERTLHKCCIALQLALIHLETVYSCFLFHHNESHSSMHLL